MANLRAASLLVALGLVGENIGLGSQSRDGMLARARADADLMAYRGQGGNRGAKTVKAPKYRGGKLARMAAKGALGSSGRFSRSRVVVPGFYAGNARWQPSQLVNCASLPARP